MDFIRLLQENWEAIAATAGTLAVAAFAVWGLKVKLTKDTADDERFERAREVAEDMGLVPDDGDED